jgi:hypothetical protein
MTRTKFAIRIAAVLLTSLAAAAEPVALVGQPAQEESQMEQFLRRGQIVEYGPRVVGEEQAHLALMTDGSTAATVMVQTLQPYRYGWFRSRDSNVYNAAAYKLDRLMGVGVAPCTVLRQIGGRLASVTFWSDSDGAARPQRVTLFRALVGDANGAFTSGFHTSNALFDLDGAAEVDEPFHSALSNLNRRQLTEALGDLLTPQEIRFLLARRDRILRR